MSANLLYTFTERELSTRYAGSALGFLWTLIGPILMLVVYSLVFGRIFNAESQSLGTTSYIHYVALALWPWLIFGDGITRGLSSIQANAALIKKVAFPLTIPVGASVGSTIIVHLVGYVAVLGALAATGHTTRISGIFGAFIILCALAALTLGVALALAALQTILRDVEQAIQPALLMLYFLTPVLYPASIIPEPYRQWLDWNPLALIMGRIRAHLLSAPGIGISDLFALCVGLIVLLAGWFVFTRLSPHFEDFL